MVILLWLAHFGLLYLLLSFAKCKIPQTREYMSSPFMLLSSNFFLFHLRCSNNWWERDGDYGIERDGSPSKEQKQYSERRKYKEGKKKKRKKKAKADSTDSFVLTLPKISNQKSTGNIGREAEMGSVFKRLLNGGCSKAPAPSSLVYTSGSIIIYWSGLIGIYT